jgi:hypothetical protein
MNAFDTHRTSPSCVVITGAHSGIGQELIKRLIPEGISVLGLVTPWCNQAVLHRSGEQIKYVACDLREALGAEIIGRCKDANILVHLAWARPKKSIDALAENRLMFDNIRCALPTGIKTVYMSSVCATSDNPSHYGQAKYHLGLHMGARDKVEIIAGLVRSNPAMGPYLALENFVCKLHAAFKFLPSPAALIADQEQVMTALVKATLDFESCPVFVQAYEVKPICLNDLIVDILKVKKVWGVPIPVPSQIVLGMLYGLRKIFPSISMLDRLITLFTVSPASLAKRRES